MQLFVTPITANLLAEENQALQDLEFAREHKIPVLSLLQETQLEKQYRDSFGKFQFVLNRNEDFEAVSYKDRLDRYLSSVLLTDQLMDKVQDVLRGAFLTISFNLLCGKTGKDPVDNYYVGLAFLSGIDVEIQRDAAVKLIVAAAERNLPEAMKKLAFMYTVGEGVDIDYKKAYRLQSKLVAYYDNECRKQQTELNVYNYISSLYDLGETCLNLYIVSEAEQCFQKQKKFAERCAQTFPNSLEIMELLDACLVQLSKIARDDGAYHTALAYLDCSIDIKNAIEKELQNRLFALQD